MTVAENGIFWTPYILGRDCNNLQQYIDSHKENLWQAHKRMIKYGGLYVNSLRRNNEAYKNLKGILL
jgi:hypothetical protein